MKPKLLARIKTSSAAGFVRWWLDVIWIKAAAARLALALCHVAGKPMR